MNETEARNSRLLFLLTILTGSFLLFLVQPMIARMALPRLGGAPAVWNSAMLVYQALLLGGYAYAHRLAREPARRQATSARHDTDAGSALPGRPFSGRPCLARRQPPPGRSARESRRRPACAHLCAGGLIGPAQATVF